MPELTEEQLELQKKWLAVPRRFKTDRCDLARSYLQSLGLVTASNNKNIHIFFTYEYTEEDVQVDIWPSTERMWLTGKDSGRKDMYQGTEHIIHVLHTLLGIS